MARPTTKQTERDIRRARTNWEDTYRNARHNLDLARCFCDQHAARAYCQTLPIPTELADLGPFHAMIIQGILLDAFDHRKAQTLLRSIQIASRIFPTEAQVAEALLTDPVDDEPVLAPRPPRRAGMTLAEINPEAARISALYAQAEEPPAQPDLDTDLEASLDTDFDQDHEAGFYPAPDQDDELPEPNPEPIQQRWRPPSLALGDRDNTAGNRVEPAGTKVEPAADPGRPSLTPHPSNQTAKLQNPPRRPHSGLVYPPASARRSASLEPWPNEQEMALNDENKQIRLEINRKLARIINAINKIAQSNRRASRQNSPPITHENPLITPENPSCHTPEQAPSPLSTHPLQPLHLQAEPAKPPTQNLSAA